MDFINLVNCHIGKKEAGQFEKALYNYNQFHDGNVDKHNHFWHEIIRPRLFSEGEDFYFPVQNDKMAAGRNHYCAKAISENYSNWPALEYFSNQLKIDFDPKISDNGITVWSAPKSRSILGKHQIFTFEYDSTCVDLFRYQMSCMRSPDGKQLNSKIGEIFRRCSIWADFAGITVNYSGNKSFHIHLVFETGLAVSMCGRDGAIREAHIEAWQRLKAVVDEVLKIELTVDVTLRFPEQLRRLPGGSRVLNKPNLLHMPAGTNVPQLILWEKYRGRSGDGATGSLFQPSDFARVATESRSIFVKRRKPCAEGDIQMPAKSIDSQIVEVNEPAMTFLSKKMQEYFPAGHWPAYARLTVQRDGALRAYFCNSATDRTPSSFMDEDYATVLIQGSNPHGLRPGDAALPATLGEMKELWLAEFYGMPSVSQNPLERDFAESVCDKDSARKEMRILLKRVLRDETKKLNLICAAEGISKSTSLFKDHRKNSRWLSQFGNGKVMYAFLSYAMAEEKCREFNEVNQDRGFFGVVLRSFDRVYSILCENLGLTELNYADLSRENFPSKWAGIEAKQPEVLETLKAEHAAMWDEIGDRKPVFFTVHAVAQRWYISGTTRLLWAPSFWKMQDCDTKFKKCLVETALSLLIHDELKISDLIASYPEKSIDQVKMLIESTPWIKAKNTIEKNSAYKRFYYFRKGKHPEFNEVLDMESLLLGKHDKVVTKDSGEYEIREIGFYEECIDQNWLIAAREWPRLSADRVLCLTTESVPTEIAEKTGLWNILRLHTPKLDRDEVMVQHHRSLISERMAEIAEKVRVEFDAGYSQGSVIISNKVDELFNSFTHEGAKGSNQFIGMDIIQTMAFKSPYEFELLEAMNAWTGSTTLVRQSHIDQFNQTAGRNLNFRRLGDPRHLLIVNQKLWPRLLGSVQTLCRYKMVLMTTEHDRRKASLIQKAA